MNDLKEIWQEMPPFVRVSLIGGLVVSMLSWGAIAFIANHFLQKYW